MGATHKSPGTNPDTNHNSRPPARIYQALLTTPCPDHGSHTVVVSALDDYAHAVANFIARSVQRAGQKALVSELTSDQPGTDISPRDDEFVACCLELSRYLDETSVEAFTTEIPF